MIEITPLAVIRTRHAYWDYSPRSMSEGITALMRWLLDADGTCYIGLKGRDSMKTEWFRSQTKACARLDECRHYFYVDAEQSDPAEDDRFLKDAGGAKTRIAASTLLHDRQRVLNKTRFLMVFDRRCFLSALRRLQEVPQRHKPSTWIPKPQHVSDAFEHYPVRMERLNEVPEGHDRETDPTAGQPRWFTFMFTFDLVKDSLVLTRNFGAWAGPPPAGELAPPDLGDAEGFGTYPPEEAAKVLRALRADDIENAVDAMSRSFELWTNWPDVAGVAVQDPIIYAAGVTADEEGSGGEAPERLSHFAASKPRDIWDQFESDEEISKRFTQNLLAPSFARFAGLPHRQLAPPANSHVRILRTEEELPRVRLSRPHPHPPWRPRYLILHDGTATPPLGGPAHPQTEEPATVAFRCGTSIARAEFAVAHQAHALDQALAPWEDEFHHWVTMLGRLKSVTRHHFSLAGTNDPNQRERILDALAPLEQWFPQVFREVHRRERELEQLHDDFGPHPWPARDDERESQPAVEPPLQTVIMESAPYRELDARMSNARKSCKGLIDELRQCLLERKTVTEALGAEDRAMKRYKERATTAMGFAVTLLAATVSVTQIAGFGFGERLAKSGVLSLAIDGDNLFRFLPPEWRSFPTAEFAEGLLAAALLAVVVLLAWVLLRAFLDFWSINSLRREIRRREKHASTEWSMKRMANLIQRAQEARSLARKYSRLSAVGSPGASHLGEHEIRERLGDAPGASEIADGHLTMEERQIRIKDAQDALLARIETCDHEASHAVIELLEDLRRHYAPSAPPHRRTPGLYQRVLEALHLRRRDDYQAGRIRDIRRRTAFFLVTTRLLEDLPRPTFLPRTTLLIRTVQDMTVARPVDDEELFQTFLGLGYGTVSIFRVRNWIDQQMLTPITGIDQTIGRTINTLTQLEEMGVGAAQQGDPKQRASPSLTEPLRRWPGLPADARAVETRDRTPMA